MSYQVLARKWRPRDFEGLVGQEHVVRALRHALEQQRLHHAYLFTGTRGVGKTTLARILAKCLVCEKGITASPDGTCALCKGVQNGSLVDVVEIDGASNNSVEQVRDLQEVARFMPQLARFRIFIIDEVHMLSTSAFNALLKILEEPPPHVKFIFATTEPHKIPVTILSRCQRYDFRRLPMKTIIERLKAVLASEHVKIDDAGLDVIARAAEGGMRDALSLTDQVLSFAGDGATAAQVTEALGVIDRRSIVTAVEACISGDAKAALSVVDAAYVRGHDQRQLLAGIAEEFRHLAVASATGSVRGFADLPDEDAARIDQRAREVDGRDLTRLLGMALDGIDPVAQSEEPRVFVELALLKMCGRPPLGDALAISEAVVRLEALAKGRPVPPLAPRGPETAATPTPRAQTPAQAPAQAPAPAQTPAPAPDRQAPPAATTPPAQAAPELLGEDPPEVVETAPEIVAAAPAPVATVVAEEEDDVDIDPAAGLPLIGVDARMRSFIDHVAVHAGLGLVAGALSHARLVSVNEQTVSLSFGADNNATLVKSNLAALGPALAAAFGDGKKLALVAEVPGASASAPTLAEAQQRALAEAQRALEAHAHSHPVVERAVALFGGQVRAVRRRA
ncbi:MAG TPA: DNA polymerase III subunit gamma/tau [Myxococcota bacterium]